MDATGVAYGRNTAAIALGGDHYSGNISGARHKSTTTVQVGKGPSNYLAAAEKGGKQKQQKEEEGEEEVEEEGERDREGAPSVSASAVAGGGGRGGGGGGNNPVSREFFERHR